MAYTTPENANKAYTVKDVLDAPKGQKPIVFENRIKEYGFNEIEEYQLLAVIIQASLEFGDNATFYEMRLYLILKEKGYWK